MISKILQNQSIEQFFLSLGQNNFGNKVPFRYLLLNRKAPSEKGEWTPSEAPFPPATNTL